MSINVRKLVTGGLAAGVVLNLLNILANLMLANRIQAEMNAWIPGSVERMSTGGGALVAGILMKLVIGTMLVWFYAAIRPRFGPGPRTASYVAIFAWVLGAIFFSDFVMMGMISPLTYALLELAQLVAFGVASWVGAWIYSE